MIYISSALFFLVLIGLAVWVFLKSDAKSIALFAKSLIPVSLLAIGIIATMAGRGQYGIPAIGIGVIWWLLLFRKSSKQ